ncbi:IGR protein motif-domain-containing protein [Parachaetomium inaequale]|uniref:Small ribosomal subunit protein mS41 n=1 Tax=Parachaetomium inaequale TaxID=2588326 RepID=A0AAN6PPC5_9PEZI|nr:IGR protein motif-domain-containing protein [Parachaetomium inaequale]
MKSLRIQSALGLLFRPCAAPAAAAPGLRAQARWAHKSAQQQQQQPQIPVVPAPIPFVPDVETFLTVIGRGLKQHASKFPTWDALFTLTSDQLRELGVEPPRTRRYLLRWRQRFREGKFGIGGDIQHVENGTAVLKIKETDKTPLVRLRHVVNVPPGKRLDEVSPSEMVRVGGFTVQGVRTIVGPYALPMKYGGARLTVTEGMWEDRRGHKVDGGERRRAEIRFKRRVAERKALREQQGYY